MEHIRSAGNGGSFLLLKSHAHPDSAALHLGAGLRPIIKKQNTKMCINTHFVFNFLIAWL